MLIYERVVISIESGQVIESESYEYDGPVARCDGGGGGGDGYGGSGQFGGLSTSEATAAAALGEFGVDVGNEASASMQGDANAAAGIAGITGVGDQGGTANTGTETPGPVGNAMPSLSESDSLSTFFNWSHDTNQTLAKGVLSAMTLGTESLPAAFVSQFDWSGDPDPASGHGNTDSATEGGSGYGPGYGGGDTLPMLMTPAQKESQLNARSATMQASPTPVPPVSALPPNPATLPTAVDTATWNPPQWQRINISAGDIDARNRLNTERQAALAARKREEDLKALQTMLTPGPDAFVEEKTAIKRAQGTPPQLRLRLPYMR